MAGITVTRRGIADGASRLAKPVANALRLPQFNLLNYGFDTNGNDVNATPWAALLADIHAQAHPRGAHIVIPAGDVCLNNLTLDTTTISLHGNVIIEGQGDATRIFPGGSQGRALTLIGGAGAVRPTVRDLRLGYGDELGTVDLAYSQPILELRSASGFRLAGISGVLAGTGTLIYLNNSFNGEVDFQWVRVGQYGVPLMVDKAISQANQMDTLKLKGLIVGDYGPVVNAAINNLETDQLKVVKSSSSTAVEAQLANAAAVNDTTIVLQAGQGASFAANDAISLDFGDTGGAGSVHYLEVNKILSISTDTLTLAQPLQFAHNGTTSHIPVYRGGIGLALGNFVTHHIHDSHFEGHDCAVQAGQGNGLELDSNSHQCNRLLRLIALIGSINDVNVGTTIAAGAPPGAPTTNIIADVPSWATQSVNRLGIEGPFVGIGAAAPTVNWQGTSYTLDSRGYVTGTGISLNAAFAVGPWLVPGVKLGRDGTIRMKGLLTMAGAVIAGTTVFTLPPWMIPFRSALTTVYQVNSQSTSATPAPNSLFVQGSDQGASKGIVSMRVASTAAGWLDLDSVAPITVHQA